MDDHGKIDSDWITITVAPGGYKKHVRRGAIMAFGALNGATFVDLNGRSIEVVETEMEIAQLVGADVLRK